MSKRVIIVLAFIVIILSLPALLRKRSVALVSDGRVVAVAKRPFVMPWRENEFDVYVGKSRVFGLWGDFFDFPLFIYPFADGKRFLCIDDDDTSDLVFIVDLRGPTTNVSGSFGWPPDNYTRNYMARRATKVVMETKGSVRLPSFAEVQEASSNLVGLPARQFKAASFPSADFGVYRFYCPKGALLSDLDTNRRSVWP